MTAKSSVAVMQPFVYNELPLSLVEWQRRLCH